MLLRMLIGMLFAGCLSLSTAAAQETSGSVSVSVSAAAIATVNYSGPAVLSFDVTPADLVAGYKVHPGSAEVSWATNLPRWRLTVHRGPWNGGASLLLQLGSDKAGWSPVTEVPSVWRAGQTGTRDKVSGLQWRVTGLDAALQPGVYVTSVHFNLVAD